MQETIKFINKIVFAGVKGNPMAAEEQPADDRDDEYEAFMDEFNHLDMEDDEDVVLRDPMPPPSSSSLAPPQLQAVSAVTRADNVVNTPANQNATAGPSKTRGSRQRVISEEHSAEEVEELSVQVQATARKTRGRGGASARGKAKATD